MNIKQLETVVPAKELFHTMKWNDKNYTTLQMINLYINIMGLSYIITVFGTFSIYSERIKEVINTNIPESSGILPFLIVVALLVGLIIIFGVLIGALNRFIILPLIKKLDNLFHFIDKFSTVKIGTLKKTITVNFSGSIKRQVFVVNENEYKLGSRKETAINSSKYRKFITVGSKLGNPVYIFVRINDSNMSYEIEVLSVKTLYEFDFSKDKTIKVALDPFSLDFFNIISSKKEIFKLRCRYNNYFK